MPLVFHVKVSQRPIPAQELRYLRVYMSKGDSAGGLGGVRSVADERLHRRTCGATRNRRSGQPPLPARQRSGQTAGSAERHPHLLLPLPGGWAERGRGEGAPLPQLWR